MIDFLCFCAIILSDLGSKSSLSGYSGTAAGNAFTKNQVQSRFFCKLPAQMTKVIPTDCRYYGIITSPVTESGAFERVPESIETQSRFGFSRGGMHRCVIYNLTRYRKRSFRTGPESIETQSRFGFSRGGMHRCVIYNLTRYRKRSFRTGPESIETQDGLGVPQGKADCCVLYNRKTVIIRLS